MITPIKVTLNTVINVIAVVFTSFELSQTTPAMIVEKITPKNIEA